MRSKHFFVVPMLMAASYFGLSATQAAPQGQSILPQGTFEQIDAANKPAGWQVQSPETTTLAGNAKNHWVQLRDGAVMMHFLKPRAPRKPAMSRPSVPKTIPILRARPFASKSLCSTTAERRSLTRCAGRPR